MAFFTIRGIPYKKTIPEDILNIYNKKETLGELHENGNIKRRKIREV